MRNALKWSALFLLCAAVAAVAVFAQTTGGGLQGKVTDASGQPVIGATIKVTGPAVQGFLGAATDINGEYRIPFVPAGKNYTVQVEAQGFNSVVRSGIEIPLGATISLPFQLGQGTSTITVVGTAPLIDLKNTVGGETLSDQMINAVPLPRGASQIAYLAPTAVDSGASTGANNPSIGGSTGAENNYIINGMDVTNTGYGTLGSNLNFEFIQDYQILTSGLPPEYGASMGGVTNAITKSGGNEFHGGAYAYYFNDSLQAKSDTYPYVFNDQSGFTQYDVGAFLGGYIVKDKLWFFVAGDYNETKTDLTAPAGSGDTNLYLDGQRATSYYAGKSLTEEDRQPQYAFKLTWNASQNHKVALSVFGDTENNSAYGSLATLSPYSAPYQIKQQPYNVSLEWNATWTKNFFSEATISYRNRHQSLDVPQQGAAAMQFSYYFSQSVYGGFQAVPADTTVAPVSDDGNGVIDLGSNYVANNGTGGMAYVARDNSLQARVKFTNILPHHHELTYGLQYENSDYDYNQGLSGPTDHVNPHAPASFGTDVAIGGGFVQWASNLDLLGANFAWPDGSYYTYIFQSYYTPALRTTKAKYHALWVNDNWNITDFFLLKLGVRDDGQMIESTLPGGDSIKLDNNIAPRVGFTWDVAHNGKSKLYGFYGRYFERVPNDMAIRSLANEHDGYEYYTDPSLTHFLGGAFYGYSELIQGQATAAYGVADKLKAPYSDEVLVGFDYELQPDLKLGVQLLYRQLGRTIEDISPDDARTYIIANPDRWTNVVTSTGVTFPKPSRRYSAAQFTLDKRWSHNWQLNASYVYSKLEGNYEGAASNDTVNGQLDPNLNATYDIPQLLQHGYGLLPLDRKHQFKAYGSYEFTQIPLTLSANLTVLSGTPLSEQVWFAWYGGSAGFITDRGTAGRTPTIYTLDLGAQYDIKLFKTNLGLRLDIFNLTNEQKTTAVYQKAYTELNEGDPQSAWVSNPYYGLPYQHQAPRALRLAVRWTF
jgi:hypothetical protein